MGKEPAGPAHRHSIPESINILEWLSEDLHVHAERVFAIAKFLAMTIQDALLFEALESRAGQLGVGFSAKTQDASYVIGDDLRESS